MADMGPATGNSPAASCRVGLQRVALFALGVFVLGAGLSWLVHPWTGLSWWKVFRRSVSIAAACVVWIMVRRQGQSIRALGLGTWREGKRDVGEGLLLGFGTVALIGALYLATPWCRIDVHPDSARVWRTVLLFVPAAGLVAVLEELIFRGYILQQLLLSSRPLALAGSSAAYALVHLRPNLEWPASGFELMGLFLLGWVLAVSVLRTNQLYLAIGLHASLAYVARVNKLLVEFTNPSLHWLLGTNRLVNGVGAWVALVGIGWMIHRRMRPA